MQKKYLDLSKLIDLHFYYGDTRFGDARFQTFPLSKRDGLDVGRVQGVSTTEPPLLIR